MIDQSETALQAVAAATGATARMVDVGNPDALMAALAGHEAVISAAPFHLTGAVAEAAARGGLHYLDLTEDVATTRRAKDLAKSAPCAFIPQCGLAPGFISIVAQDLARHFDALDSIRMRVGALPQFPSNALNYNLTWSTDGVINEYIEPCEAIVDGRLRETRRWKSARNSRSMVLPMRRSTPPAGLAPCAKPCLARSAPSTTAPSAIPAMQRL